MAYNRTLLKGNIMSSEDRMHDLEEAGIKLRKALTKYNKRKRAVECTKVVVRQIVTGAVIGLAIVGAASIIMDVVESKNQD